MLSNTRFNSGQPYWQDYLPFLQALASDAWPDCNQLNALLPVGLSSESGQSIRFVPSDLLTEDAYERRIYTSGQVSTRRNNWHDIFNALVWMRFPRIKTAINALHYRDSSLQKSGSRGRLRDALTLFDECGVLVYSHDLELLKALAERRWRAAFFADEFSHAVRLSICGHAMLEKYLSPYKAMTAKALLVHVDQGLLELPRQEALERLDRGLAQQLLDGTLLTTPACLAPLPLAGVPGWWPAEEQGCPAFYQDSEVFRPPPDKLAAAPVISLL